MRTFFKDFTPAYLERAWQYAATRSSLGHNVRLVTFEEEDRKYHRVYFSSGLCNPTGAINVKDLPTPEKK